MKKFTDKINESVENKIPTAEEFFFDYSVDDEYDNLSVNCKQEILYKATELIKLHVEAALKAASEKVSLTDFAYEFLQEGAYDAIDKETILNAYPLDNIK
jgi:hypothetical protein